MNNIKLTLIGLCFLTVSLGLRQSDIGVNDWARENIGKMQQLSFPYFGASVQDTKGSRQSKNIFFYSELGLFGHLNKRTGEIITRQSLADGEILLQSDNKELVILTANGQIVRYSKYSMARSVDNRMFLKDTKKVHSFANLNGKVYISDDKAIKQYQAASKSLDELASFPSAHGTILKTFVRYIGELGTLHAITYNGKKGQVCINDISETGNRLVEKQCIKAKLGEQPYVKIFSKTGDIYFGDQEHHHHFNFISVKSKKLNSKPISFYEHGALLENGLTFSSRGIEDQKIIQAKVSGTDKIIFGEESLGYLTLYTGTEKGKEQKLLSINLNNRQSKVSKIWVNFGAENQHEIIVQFSDLQLVLFTLQDNEYRQAWSREQSLAYVDKVLFMKYEGYADHLNNPYHMKMDDPQYSNLSLAQKIQNIPQNIASRIKAEVEDIYYSFISIVQNAKKLLTNPQLLENIFDIKSYFKASMSDDKQKKYGLRKYILVITSYNTMFSIDTKTSNIIWKKKYGNDEKLVTLIKLKQQYEKEIAIALNYKYHITYVNQIHQDGSMTELAEFQTGSEPTVHKISPHAILIKGGEKVHRYDINKELFGSEKEYNFFSIEDRKVIGWKIANDEAVQTWALELPASETIIKSTSVYRGQPQANLPISNDKKILFKNVDFSNLAVLTMQQYLQQTAEANKTAHRLHIYMINGLTGNIQFSQYQTGINPNLPINLVYDEHNAIVSYYNTRNRVYELWTIQAYQIPQQSQLLSKKYEPEFQKEDILFRTKVYGTVIPIKHIFISESKQALLRRNLLIITRQNKIYSLLRDLVSTRRPKSADPEQNANSGQADFTNTKYPPEEYILSVNPLAYLNYNRKMMNLQHMRFSSSDLQSTIFIMAYGIDIFLVRTSPDKAFDMLADGFNYLQLIAILIAVTGAALFFKTKVKQVKLRKAHLD